MSDPVPTNVLAQSVGTQSGDAPRWRRFHGWVVPVLVVAVLGVMLDLLGHEVAHLRYHDVMSAVRAVPTSQILQALLWTVVSYALLPAYDVLALRYAEHRLSFRRLIYGSVVTYGLSQTLGFPALTGGAVRVRLWSAWGLENNEIVRAVAFAGTSFTLGLLALGGVVGISEPAASLQALRVPVIAIRALAVLALSIVGLYALLSVFAGGRSVRLWRLALPVPRKGLVAGQLAVACVDWTVAAAVLYVLLPHGTSLHFSTFVALFLVAQTAGVLSHIPAGLGVFETLMLLQLRDTAPVDGVLASLVAYRAVFYLMPFAVALIMLAALEIRLQHERLSRTATVIAAGFGRWAEPLLPTAIGTMTLVGGSILLFSGATPPVRGRIGALISVLPLGVIELSHFAGSLAGAGLVILGWALTRRLDAGWHLARALVLVGIVASLLKGLDYEEALALSAILGILQLSRDAFYRKSALLAEPLTPGWIAAILTIVGVSVWIGFFSYKHVDYSTELWWRFAVRGDAPRFFRASAGAAALLGSVAVLRLLRHAPAAPDLPSASERQQVSALIPKLEETTAALALLGDKHLMFAESGNGFLMYGVSGRSWVALGDPLGPLAEKRELAWRFREAADQHGAWPVFYEVTDSCLPLYLDLGLTLLKMGEAAIVQLQTFSLDGGARRGLRRTHRQVLATGASFEVVPPESVRDLLPDLRAISDEWLSAKSTREKGFSLGRFDPEYLQHFPHAIVRLNGRIVAFANLWTGNGHELSLDLMRYAAAAPPSVMEFLFLELLLWGREHGFERAELGMAPLSGLSSHSLSPRWHRLGGLLYRHGEHFYNFQGLRRYKEKFDPVWEPRYLAVPAGLALPRILSNIATLVSGGITGLLTK